VAYTDDDDRHKMRMIKNTETYTLSHGPARRAALSLEILLALLLLSGYRTLREYRHVRQSPGAAQNGATRDSVSKDMS
jgi:hypothetical protein